MKRKKERVSSRLWRLFHAPLFKKLSSNFKRLINQALGVVQASSKRGSSGIFIFP
jgi:hypothetical protein